MFLEKLTKHHQTLGIFCLECYQLQFLLVLAFWHFGFCVQSGLQQWNTWSGGLKKGLWLGQSRFFSLKFWFTADFTLSNVAAGLNIAATEGDEDGGGEGRGGEARFLQASAWLVLHVKYCWLILDIKTLKFHPQLIKLCLNRNIHLSYMYWYPTYPILLYAPNIVHSNEMCKYEYDTVPGQTLSFLLTWIHSLADSFIKRSAAPDLCSEYNGGCHQNADCNQTGLLVNCTCRTGYQGDGYSCEPINRWAWPVIFSELNLFRFCGFLFVIRGDFLWM